MTLPPGLMKESADPLPRRCARTKKPIAAGDKSVAVAVPTRRFIGEEDRPSTAA
jgi:hypothetical protein